jgi:carbon storage regulator
MPYHTCSGLFRRMGMLVLSRHNEESIMIGDDIEVEIVGIRGRNVRLGIEAPRQVSVHRREIYDRVGPNPLISGIGNTGRCSA